MSVKAEKGEERLRRNQGEPCNNQPRGTQGKTTNKQQPHQTGQFSVKKQRQLPSSM
ncbi:Hypothetical predicted protein, partial [Paramuricea clavata]